MTLREEHGESGDRYLSATVRDGDLVLEGHDLGPGTAVISSTGEHEWYRTVRAAHVPALREAIGATPDDDLLAVLARDFSGLGSYDLEKLLRDGAVPSELWVA